MSRVPPKRKRGGGSAAASVAPEHSHKEMDLIASVLSEWNAIAKDKPRSLELVTALVENQCMTIGATDHTDAYWLLLATHTINRLVHCIESHASCGGGAAGKQKQQQQLGPVAVVLAHLCHSVATVMMVEKSKLERLTLKQVRSLVGRAMVTLTVGSLTAMAYTSGKALWASVLALDMVVFQQTIKTTPTLDRWHVAHQALTSYVEDDVAVLSDIDTVAKLVKISAEEKACLLTLQSEPPPTPSKRNRRGPSTSPSSDPAPDSDPELSQLHATFAKLDLTPLEGRVIIRRMPSMALIWLVNGQERILQFCLEVLHNGVDEIPAQTVGTPTKKKSNRKLTSSLTIPANVAKVTLVSRLMAIVAEALTNGGSRPPVGGMDSYVQTHLTGKKVMKAVDVRDLMVVTMHALVQAHAECLADSKPLALVNDDEATAVTTSNGGSVARFCPVVHKTLDALCRAEGASTRKLLSIVASHILQSNVMDAKLCSFAIGQFHNSFSFLLDGREASSTDMVESYKALQPLPTPTLPKATKNRRKKEEECTFGGLLDKSNPLAMDQALLPLYFRALGSPAAIFSLLLDIMEACYDTTSTNSSLEEMTAATVAGKPKKQTKKLKLALPDRMEPNLRRLTAIRAGLASDACNVFRSLTITQHALQAYFRSCLSVDHLCRFVRLMGTLESILTTTSSDAKNRGPAASFFHPSSTDFNLYERTLWSSHTNLCYILGRGTMLYSSVKKDAVTPILGDAKTRLTVFQEIPISCGSTVWPLHLPASFHALVTTNLSSEPVLPGQQEPEEYIVGSLVGSISEALEDPSLVTHAKRLGDNSGDMERTTDEKAALSFRDARLLLVAISRLPGRDQLRHLSALAKVLATSLVAYQLDDSLRSVIVEHGEVAQFVARVVTVYVALLNLVSADLTDALVEQVGPYQYSLPPLYTLGDILNGAIAKDGNWYRKDCCFMGLLADWESPTLPAATTKMSLSNDILSKTDDILEHALQLGFQCARKDYGQLMFAAWNASGRKLTWDPRGLKDASIKPFSNRKSWSSFLMELRDDVCSVYWQINGHKRASLPNSLLGQTLKKHLTSQRAKPLQETLNAMLAKAISAVHHLLETPDVLQEFEDIELTLFEALPGYVAFVMAMHTTTIDTMFSRLAGKKKEKVGNTRRKVPASNSSCYDIELLASIMSDEDSGGSDDDFDHEVATDDSRIDGLSQLHDACNLFGAAPIHPDWLDNTCSFREGIDAVVAGQNAAMAIECLTKLGTIANAQHSNAVKKCMAVLAGKNPGDPVCDTAASLCCLAIDSSNGMVPPDTVFNVENEFQGAVAAVFRIPPVAIQDFYNDSASTGWRAAKEAWIPNCPQQIIGLIQSQSIDGVEASGGEYRAGGDWEMLLSEALAGSCTGCGMDDLDNNIWKSFDVTSGDSIDQRERVFDAYILEERWLRISQGVVSQLMPAAALLRFRQTAASGRIPHPLSVGEGTGVVDPLLLTSSTNEIAEFACPTHTLTEPFRLALLECLSFLTSRSARSNGDDVAKRCCSAVASNLLVDAQPCEDVEGIEAISMAFDTIEAMQNFLRAKPHLEGTSLSSFRHLISMLINMLQTRGKSPGMSKLTGKESDAMRIFACISSGTNFVASVLGIARFEKGHLFGDESAVRDRAVKCLVFVLCADDAFVDGKSRAAVADILGEILELEVTIDSSTSDPRAIRSALQRTLSSLKGSLLQKLVELAYPEKETADSCLLTSQTASGVSKMLALALSGDLEDMTLKFCRTVFDILQIRLETVETLPESRESSLGLVFLYGCRLGSLDAIGASLIDRLSVGSLLEPALIQMECLLSFVQGLRVARRDNTTSLELPGAQLKSKASKELDRIEMSGVSHREVARACSHVTRNGFFHQHWYNCYTCGLVFDKGCCTLCALVCHSGHEVAYSRSSSFFCDCGADVASAGEQNRVICKCINLLSEEEAKMLWQEERAKNYLAASSEKELSDRGVVKICSEERGRPMDLFVNVALIFAEEASMAIEDVKAAASHDSWVLTIFGKINDPSQEESTILMLGDGDGASIPAVTQESMVAALVNRSGTPLELERLENPKLVPIRAARAGSFNVKLALDSATDRVKRTMLARHGVVRSAVVADSRGRLIIAEPSSLVFCSILPAINTRYVDDPLTSQIGRSQMSVVTSHSLSFDIVGMQICKQNERHVVVWGSSEACVVVLKKHGNGVEKAVHLDLDLDPHECDSDFVLGCDWVPASQTLVAVACGTFVKVYSVVTAKNDEIIIPQLSYNVAYEAVIKDTAWVSLPFPSRDKQSDHRKRKLILFLLMDTGRLHEMQLQLDGQGNLDGQGSSFLEGSSRCIDIPTVGVRPYEGANVGKAGSSTGSMGEGCSLCFLPLSNMLLYKCISSCVVALPFGKKGEIVGSFELLPNRIDSEILGNGPDAYSIVGPYTHWKEIGLVDGGIRLVCIGKSSRTNHPKLLSIVVKAKSVKIKEIAWCTGGSVGLGLSLSSSFEGLTVFSGPSLSPGSRFDERLYFCVVTSNGSILIYGEDSNESIQAGEHSVTPGDRGLESYEKKGKAKPEMALTFYEGLLNVSEVDELRFSGDGIGSGNSDSIKDKLSSKNSVYLMSPSRDGCTITVALEGPVDMSKLGDREVADSPMGIPNLNDKGKHREHLAIVALRFLVGSTTTDCLPSCLFVQGRPVQLTPSIKRWYDVPLTLEEVLMAVRSGSVSIGLGPTFESGNSPLVDAVEVYAVPKKRLHHLIPQALEGKLVGDCVQAKVPPERSDCASTLVLKTRILSFLYQLVGARLNQDTPEGKSLKHLIRSTAFNEDRSVRDHVVKLLERVETKSDLRQTFLDEGTLLGISSALKVVSNIFRQAQAGELEEKHFGEKLKSQLEASLRSATTIALARPENYVKATETLSSEGLSPTSIALDSSHILMFAIKAGLDYQGILENVVHLVLAELSIGTSYTESAKCSFATFDIISDILKLEHQDVVERCCNAVRSFLDTYSPAVKKQVTDFFNSVDADMSAPIAYQCDSCSKFPITDSRFTLLDDDRDIDLCIKCYEVARAYAIGIDVSPNSPVIINGRSIGGSIKLSCGQIKLMESVPIANGPAIVEQVELALQEAKSAGPRATDAEGPLRAIQRSEPMTATSSDKIAINFETFTDCLFDNIIGLVGYMLDGSSSGVPIGRLNPLLTLVLDSISFGENENAHVSRGKRYSREVLKYIRRMLGAVRSGARSEKTRYVLLINFLRSLGRLAGANNDDITGASYDASEAGLDCPDKVKRKTDPRFVCDVHSVPAVRRRCSTGGNKNKRFYVCGMDRKQRCKYFKWADESKPQPPGRVGQRNRLEKELEIFIWQLLSDSSQSRAASLSDKLCDLMEAEFSRSDCGSGQDVRPSEVKSSGDQIPVNNEVHSNSLYDREAAMNDLQDGVFCSKEKVSGVAPHWMCTQDSLSIPRELLLPDDESGDQNLADRFIEASLDLVSTVASASSSGDLLMPGNKRWFSLLCEVISANPASRFRPQAKKALKRMCGGNRALCHSVGDHYVFGFQLKEILYHAKAALDGALCVREMARQCGEKWSEEGVSWHKLEAGELLGTLDLVPEDCLTAANAKRIGAILDELLSVSKSRVDNWRHFCSLLALPVSYHQRPGLSVFGQERLLIERTFCGPTILSLFWLCCAMSGPNQVRAMKLVELALTLPQDRKSLSASNSKAAAGSCEVFGDNVEGVVSDAIEGDTEEISLPFTAAPQANPEDTLVKGPKALSVEDIFAFAMQFVLGGRTADLRRIACQIANKLCRRLDARSLFQLFRLLVEKPLAEIESLGGSSVQYLQLLQSVIKVGDWKGSQDLSQAGKKIAIGFAKQMNLFRWMGGRVHAPVDPGRNIHTKRFDLSSCVHCHRLQHSSQKSGNGKTSPTSNDDKKSSKDVLQTIAHKKGTADGCKPSEPRWLPDQVRPFVRIRLDNSTENTCSSEFAVLVQLKSRLAISEIHVTVNEPRGRYAKTIAVSFTPRQVADVNELKSSDYEELWQECATLTLTRGATQASCILPIAVTAANLKFEYRDFYDRAGGSRAADGSFVLFCPRCSRPVNNAHGVCGSCGECLFQCRRCRHIQYDRPDAFLCTECGHCSSGLFSYELNAGVASNAVAIVDDESYARMVKVSRVATKLHGDLQTALVEMVRTGSRKRAPPEVHPLSEYSPAMKRALMGDLPKVDGDSKKGNGTSNEGKNIGTNDRSAEGRTSSNAAYRARSLLRLARQLRSEGDHAGRSRELLVREAFLGGSEFSLEELDDDGADIVGLFGVGDRSDTLTRLVASITSRPNAGRSSERAITDTSTVVAGNTSTTALTKKDSIKTSAQECEKLYLLMREAERECHELGRRLDAWDRLERDCLKGTILESDVQLSPTKCSRCAGPVTLHLLLLLLRLVRSDKIRDIESVVTGDFVRALFLEPPSMVKELFELKRLAITTLCLKSEHAAKLILDELRARLRACNDEISASILGKLLEHDFSLSAQFLALANETLNSSFMLC